MSFLEELVRQTEPELRQEDDSKHTKKPYSPYGREIVAGQLVIRKKKREYRSDSVVGINFAVVEKVIPRIAADSLVTLTPVIGIFEV